MFLFCDVGLLSRLQKSNFKIKALNFIFHIYILMENLETFYFNKGDEIYEEVYFAGSHRISSQKKIESLFLNSNFL